MNERLTQLVSNAPTSVGDFLPHLVGSRRTGTSRSL